MLRRVFFLLFFITTSLFSQNILQKQYYIKNNTVMLSDIVNITPQNDIQLFVLEPHRHTLRVKTKRVLELLKENGYNDYISKHRGYVQFTKRSPIDTTPFKEKIARLYKSKYNSITIKSIEVHPNVYMEHLPQEFTVHFEKNSYLRSHGTLYIKTPRRQKIFFHYTIIADVTIYKAKHDIRKGTPLESKNCQKNSIMLDKFRAMPLQDIYKHRYQSRHYIRSGHVITMRDVSELDLVRRGERVNIFINDANIEISFSAKALQNGKLGSTIEVLNQEGKRIKVIVTGKNRAEVR